MVHLEYDKAGKDFEMFGKRIRIIQIINESGNEGIIKTEINNKLIELSEKDYIDSNQTRKEIDYLEELNIVKVQDAKSLGLTGNKKYVTLSEKGKMLYKYFFEFSRYIPTSLTEETINVMKNEIAEFKKKKSSKGKLVSMNELNNLVQTKIGFQKYDWTKFKMLHDFINDFITINNQPEIVTEKFYRFLSMLYTSGYYDKKNFENFETMLDKGKIEDHIKKLYYIIQIVLYSLVKEPDNDYNYQSLLSILEKLRFMELEQPDPLGASGKMIYIGEHLISYSNNIIVRELPKSIVNRLSNDLDDMLIEFEDKKQPAIEKFMDILTYK